MSDKCCGRVLGENGKLKGCDSTDIAVTWLTIPLCQDCLDEMCKYKDENDFPLKRGKKFEQREVL